MMPRRAATRPASHFQQVEAVFFVFLGDLECAGFQGEVAIVAEAVGADDGWRTWSLFIVGNAHIGSNAVGGGGVGWWWLVCWCRLWWVGARLAQDLLSRIVLSRVKVK